MENSTWIDLLLNNRPKYFQKSNVFETRLSNLYELTCTVLKAYVPLILSNLQLNHCMFWKKDIKMKNKIWNTTSFTFVLLTTCFLAHNDVYEQNISRQRLNICPKTYSHKKWSAPITYYFNHGASYKLLISGDIDSNPGPNGGNRSRNHGDANVRAPKCNKCKSSYLLQNCINKL